MMSGQILALPVSFRIQNINFFCKNDILRIFGYLDSSEIARTVFPVCKKWHEIGRDPMLWKKLHIDTLTYEIDYRIERQIMQVVQNCTLLEDLYVSSHDDVSRILGYVGRFCPRLKYLQLCICSVEDNLCVETLVLGCPFIQALSVFNATGSALNGLAELKRLKFFDISDGDEWFDDTFLSRLSTNNRHLENVLLDDNEYYNDRHLVPLFDNLKSVLKRVDVDGSNCSSCTYEAIANCKKLESLGIDNALKLKNGDLNKLQALSQLKCFYVTNAKKISSSAIARFIANGKLTELESVRFEGCPAVNQALEKSIASHDDTVFHTVKRIDLSRCKNITDRLVELILKGNPVLEDFKLAAIPSLRGTAFNSTDTSIASFLKNLNVSKCFQIVKSYLHTFQKNRPHLSIVFPSHFEFPSLKEY